MERAVLQTRFDEAVEPRRAPIHGSFRALARAADWAQLPPPVRARFEREFAPGDSAAFVGEIAETRMTNVGWLWAQVARLVGEVSGRRYSTRTRYRMPFCRNSVCAAGVGSVKPPGVPTGSCQLPAT